MSQKSWTLLMPIHNLEIAQDIGGEYKIEDVMFVDADKLPRIRKRLGLPLTVGEYKSKMPIGISGIDPFKSAKTYAVVRTKREDKQSLDREFRLIREAIYLLASSQFFRVKRHNRTLFGGPEFGQRFLESYPLLCNENQQWKWSNTTVGPYEPYRLNKAWIGYTRHSHFPGLVTILNRKKQVHRKWRETLRRACLLAGQSYFARNIWEAYIYDMIALETLLTRGDEKFPDAIIDKIVALFGWITNEDTEMWKRVTTRLYQLRCQFVHDGEVGDVTVVDLYSADKILGNILLNLCTLTSHIQCKDDIFTLTERYKAQKTLGIKIQRPRNIQFIDQGLSKHDEHRLQDPKHWWW